jgi:hypothetical protein
MSVPDDSAIARQLAAEGYFVRVARGDQRAASLFARLCALRLNPTGLPSGYGWLRKGGGTNVDGYAEDAIVFGNDPNDVMNVVDTVVGTGAPGASLPSRWTAVPRRTTDTWEAPRPLSAADLTYLREGAVPPPVPGRRVRIGASFFWLLTGRTKYADQVDRNLDWIAGPLDGDFVRALVVLGGDLFSAIAGRGSHQSYMTAPESLTPRAMRAAVGSDPWSDVGTRWDLPGFRDHVARTTRYVFDRFGLKIMWTLIGGRSQVMTTAQQEAVCDIVISVAREMPECIELIEPWNEYLVNGGTTHELRAMHRRLRAGVPAQIPIALSSPNTVMGESTPAEVRAELASLYPGLPPGAALTYHVSRAPNTIWMPGADLGPDAPDEELSGMTEPPGPGASAGGDADDPNVLGDHLSRTMRAGWRWYVLHTRPGVWGGHCDRRWPAENTPANLFEVPNAAAIAARLRAVNTGTIDPGPVPPGGAMPIRSYPDEGLIHQHGKDVQRAYDDAHAPFNAEAGVWFSRPMDDYYRGTADFATVAAVRVQELRRALGLDLPPAA